MQTLAIKEGKNPMEFKRVRISNKRQITIPQKYYTALGFGDEAECILRGNEVVIRPVRENVGGEFSEQILADLIRQGYSGEELLCRFKEAQSNIRPAVEIMLEQARKAADSESEYLSYNDVFEGD